MPTGEDGTAPVWGVTVTVSEPTRPETVVEKAGISAENSVALVIGPPIMIQFTLPVLSKMGLADSDIYTSLENRMKCGVGKCGRCNCGPLYVCKEGPVFTLEQLKQLPNDY